MARPTASKMLDRAAAGRREAQRRQEQAAYLCISCKGPDGEHVSECQVMASQFEHAARATRRKVA